MNIRNGLLAACGDRARAALSPYLLEISLRVGRVLACPGTAVDYVHFPTSGVVSIVTIMQNGRGVGSLTVGNEGAIGLPEALGDRSSDVRAIVQVAGTAWRISTENLLAVVRDHPVILDVVTRYAQTTQAQLHQSAACHALHGIDARLCRLLLTCEDRVGDPVLPLTQELLALMLGVQRTTVTHAAQAIQRRGAIAYKRGQITILDRAAIERSACECYRVTGAQYARVFPALEPG